MENAGYTVLTRQTGLIREMQTIANNIANATTTGFKAEGVVFSEYVMPVERGASLSMGQGNVAKTSLEQGSLTQTGGTFDLAIEGDGFFLIETPLGERLTRAGSFSPDAGGAPIFVPPGASGVSIANDGTLSADGNPLGQIGVVRPNDPLDMVREDGVMFDARTGFEPVETPRVLQGFVEGSNTNPLHELARMVDVQRAYEMGQSFLDAENERMRTAMKAMLT